MFCWWYDVWNNIFYFLFKKKRRINSNNYIRKICLEFKLISYFFLIFFLSLFPFNFLSVSIIMLLPNDIIETQYMMVLCLETKSLILLVLIQWQIFIIFFYSKQKFGRLIMNVGSIWTISLIPLLCFKNIWILCCFS